MRRLKRATQLSTRRRGKLGAPPRHPNREIARLEQELLAIAGSHNVALLRAIRPLLDAEGTITPSLLAELRRRVRASITFDADGAAKVAVKTLDRLDRFNRADVRRSIGVDVPEFSTALGQKWRTEHVALIKSMGEEPKARFLKLFEESSKKQTRVETLKKQLEEQFGVSSRRARLIARDQVLTLNAKLNEDRQAKAGITEYVWRTVGDGSVRSNHSHLNGKRFKYAEPPMGGGTSEDERGNPGTGIGCRCQAIPVVQEFEEIAPRPDAGRRNPLAFSTSEPVGPLRKGESRPQVASVSSRGSMRSGGNRWQQLQNLSDEKFEAAVRAAEARELERKRRGGAKDEPVSVGKAKI